MKKDDKIRALIDAYTELAESKGCSERSTMEALLDIFDPKELTDLGYRGRVIAYLKDYDYEKEINHINKMKASFLA